MFRKILIANRGEIAARVIRTVRRLGVRTVAVHSEADAGALHAQMADEAVLIGPAPVAESYLKADRIIEAALKTGAEAIHPGFGFLSENPEFVEAVEEAGLTFIGPSASAIRAMGLKDAAKKLMEEAGVPVVPGYHGQDQDPAFLAAEAEKIGYPVLIKARAGGGGKGMRRVDDPADFAAALSSASSEATASFGDGRVLIEKYILSPRHIEIQVFGDKHGNVVHLFERDCSLQRRHQKVIEEAPAPGMTAKVREAMGAAAVRAAEAIDYAGAGTIEFIVDGANGLRPNGFWFMEMNTRLQVEHPVTEAITGVDLVEWQLRVASGDPLPKRQDELEINGWAFEARLYAEDAAKGFLPATGRLAHLKFPENARIETGVRPGDAITPHYDPMIAKIITEGPDRAAALQRLTAALRATEIAGTVTNLGFLARLSADAGFARGDVDTGLIERGGDALTAEPAPAPLVWAVAALAALDLPRARRGADPFDDASGFRLWSPATAFTRLSDGEDERRIGVAQTDGGFTLTVGDDTVALGARLIEGGVAIDHAGHTATARILRSPGAIAVLIGGDAYRFTIPDPLAAGADEGAGGDEIRAPMPGLVKAVETGEGANVKAGEHLVILEAMKMEHSLKAPRDGVVASVAARPGDQIDEGALILALAPEEDT